ncbi:MAG: hypothetical protein KBD78_02990 [Oligoflexales bacterium]|nr:hypothetical protein [Oligoflexales bacterium]
MADSSQKTNFIKNHLSKIRDFFKTKSKRFKIILAISLGFLVLSSCLGLAFILFSQNSGVTAKLFIKKKSYACSPLDLLQDLRRQQDEKQAALFAIVSKYSRNITDKNLASDLRQVNIVYKDDLNQDELQKCMTQADPKWETSIVLLNKHKILLEELTNSISLTNQGRETEMNLIMLDLNENKDEFEDSLTQAQAE